MVKVVVGGGGGGGRYGILLSLLDYGEGDGLISSLLGRAEDCSVRTMGVIAVVSVVTVTVRCALESA